MLTRWRLTTRVAFRFCFIFFGLYSLEEVFGGVAFSQPVRSLVSWVGAHIFHIAEPIVVTTSGSGDRLFDYILAFRLFAIAVLGTTAWSILDRRRAEYVTLHKWFRVLLRLTLGMVMISYGMIKVIPVQMPAPLLQKLIEPLGSLSPMGILWSSIGASPAYERFAGAAELLGGVLLFLPWTTTLGALICLADTTQIFALNMTYDVPVKLFSFHLLLMSIVLLAPDIPRLTNLLLWNRAAPPSTQPPLFRSPVANWTATMLQVALAVTLLFTHAESSLARWREYGGGAPRPPLYGIWTVQSFIANGGFHMQQLRDPRQWRRVLFDESSSMVVQQTDDSRISYHAAIDQQNQTIVLTDPRNTSSRQTWAYSQSTPDTLLLEGALGDGRQVHALLKRFEPELLTRGFHWIQEVPYNR